MTWFSYLHPLSKCVYLICIAVCVMAVMNPVCLFFAFLLLLLYLKTAFRDEFIFSKYYLFLAAAMILINLLFNHRGVHILFYLFDKPVTLESFFWGFSSALVILCIILISILWSKSISNSEFLFVFGRFMPKTALLISMTCSFAALFTNRMEEIQTILKLKGIDISKGSLKKRAGDGAQIINVLVAYSLENALITAKSMKTRGYALEKRTSYLFYRLRTRDYFFIGFSALMGVLVLVGGLSGAPAISIFPGLRFQVTPLTAAVSFLPYLLLAAAPLYKINAYKAVPSEEAADGCRY